MDYCIEQISNYLPYELKMILTEDLSKTHFSFDKKILEKGTMYELKGVCNNAFDLSMPIIGKGQIESFIFEKNKTFISINTGFKFIFKPIKDYKNIKFSAKVQKELNKYSEKHILKNTLELPYYVLKEFFSNHLDVFNINKNKNF